ncbi:hypothetical protein [Janthinobacterium sp. RB2R34]|uniref:hypothetical protein n=1 Tax=Janthinobacterium sp. RB2R34 TaxID=3424193 RepID=UPI003F21543C
MGICSPEFIFKKLKFVAKQGRRENAALSQAETLDMIAVALGYNNWSLLSKAVQKMDNTQLGKFRDDLYQHPKLAEYLPPIFPSYDKDEAIEEMTAWVKDRFTPLVDFASFDREAENGFDRPDEDLVWALNENFDDRFPLSLIEEVGKDLENNYGPCGKQDYGNNVD